METINVDLPKGGSLEVHITPEFIMKVQEHFNIDSMENVNHDHIRMFIYGSVKGAIEKAEKNR